MMSIWATSNLLERSMRGSATSKPLFAGTPRSAFLSSATLSLGSGAELALADDPNRFVPRFQGLADPEGSLATLNLRRSTDMNNNAFFQDLGTNGTQSVLRPS
jgi:hypothetical protein